MAAGTSNSQYFTHEYLIYSTSTSGVFTTSNYSASSKTGFTVTDTPDSNLDDTTQLGDIANDHFTGQVNGGNAYTRTYYGHTTANDGVVGVATGKKGAVYFLYTNASYAPNASIAVNQQPVALLCFVSGTLIRTDQGEVPVERLKVGDLAVTASGAARAITWIGHRHVQGGGVPLSQDLSPVRIMANAFGSNQPARDLYLSPGHPVLVAADADGGGGVLVPIMCLINGTTVAKVESVEAIYWHVELECHDILLAEGLPAESYMELGARVFFEDASDMSMHNPDFIAPGMSGRCRPIAVDGPLVEAERLRLDAHFSVQLMQNCEWSQSNVGAWLAA